MARPVLVDGAGGVDATAAPPRRDRRRLAFAALGAITVGVWLALLRLGVAFVDNELDWRYVAEQSRRDAPWYYRLAGVWGGMDGSLLLFAGIVGIVALLAVRRAGPAARWCAVITVGALALVDVVMTSPFGRLDAPAGRGFGLTPILEHPAMTAHPPILYAGLASAFGAFLAAVDRRSPWPAVRPWLLTTIGLLTFAMTLGAVWSYMEQGWGGYWAWDPVENTSLVVWLAALVALHGVPLADRAWTATAGAVAPWLLGLAGTTIVRSGISPSIHGFSEQLSVGRALLVLTVVTVVIAAVVIRRRYDPARGGERAPRRFGDQLVTVVLAATATIVVLAGTVVPVVSELGGGRSTAVRGEFYARTVGPLALVAVPFLVRRFRRRRGWSTVAHVGALVLLAGIAASTFDRSATVPVASGATVEAAGRSVANEAVEVVAGPRADTDAVVADLRVDGRSMRPALVVYPDRGGRLAETAVRATPLTDVQAILEGASDNGDVVVTIHVRHLMGLVWLGALVVTVATLAAIRRPTPF